MVERSGGDSGEVSLTYATVSESALAGSDFTEANGILTWADGDSAAQSIKQKASPLNSVMRPTKQRLARTK